MSYLYFADRVNQLPLGVIGVAVGTALLPLMARQLRAGQVEHAMHSQNRALELALLLTVPAAVALVVLSLPIVSVLFERGAFDAEASRATGAALAAYALGLPAYVLVKVLTPGFFAREDTRTPVKIAIVCLISNVVIALALIWWLAHVGIALATAHLGLAERRPARARPAPRRPARGRTPSFRRRLPRILAGSLALALACGSLAPWLAGIAPPLALALLVAGGGARASCSSASSSARSICASSAASSAGAQLDRGPGHGLDGDRAIP